MHFDQVAINYDVTFNRLKMHFKRFGVTCKR